MPIQNLENITTKTHEQKIVNNLKKILEMPQTKNLNKDFLIYQVKKEKYCEGHAIGCEINELYISPKGLMEINWQKSYFSDRDPPEPRKIIPGGYIITKYKITLEDTIKLEEHLKQL